jgi:hypothetical protein
MLGFNLIPLSNLIGFTQQVARCAGSVRALLARISRLDLRQKGALGAIHEQIQNLD